MKAVVLKGYGLPIAQRFPLARAGEAMRLAERGGAGGKVLILM